MPRLKTGLSPDDQWLRTARHVPRDVGSFVAFERWRRYIAERQSGGPLLSDLILRELWRERRRDQMHVGADGGSLLVGVIVRPHRLFGVGDVLRIASYNGMTERYAVLGVSSKGVRVAHLYVKLHFDGVHNGVMRCHAVPRALTGYRWDDPAVCRFIDEVRADVIGS
jgi:hypothetical protein